jgi:hypothetical protein
MTNVKPDDDRQDSIPDKLYDQQHAPKGYDKNINKKRPWNQPDLTFTLKRSAVDGRPKRSKYARSQNVLNQKFEDKKRDTKNEDYKVENEGKDQTEEEKDDMKEETQIRIKTKRTREKKKAWTKTKKRKTIRKKKRNRL